MKTNVEYQGEIALFYIVWSWYSQTAIVIKSNNCNEFSGFLILLLVLYDTTIKRACSLT